MRSPIVNQEMHWTRHLYSEETETFNVFKARVYDDEKEGK